MEKIFQVRKRVFIFLCHPQLSPFMIIFQCCALDFYIADHSASSLWSCSLELSTSSRSRLVFIIVFVSAAVQSSQSWTV